MSGAESINISLWLEGLGLGRYAGVFAENAITWDVLHELTESDLEKLGLVLGHRKQLLKAVAKLPADATGPGVGPARSLRSERAVRRAGDAERRQLTVFFSDLAGWTELSQRFDPEDMREIMRRYRDVVAESIARYGGYLAAFLGDGVLAYFGWPQSHENEAERAVRAGLEVAAAVRTVDIGDGFTLHARVGIATGSVVVGNLLAGATLEADSVTGKTPNLAARLQAVAGLDEVVVDKATHSLIGDAFSAVDLGEFGLKGFAGTQRAWRIDKERRTESRFEMRGNVLTRFVDRERERELLAALCSSAKKGLGQVVVISGEAGIGKSRLLREFRETIAAPPHVFLHYQCSPYHVNSAFYPVARQLEIAARLAPEDSPRNRRRKLSALIGRADGETEEAAALFASLLSLGGPCPQNIVELTPEHRKLRTYEVLFEQLRALARRRPVALFAEDLHWIDHTSEEFLNRLVPRIANLPVLIVLTHRPEWLPPFAGQRHVTLLPLERLAKPDVKSLVRTLAGDEVSSALVDKIVVRADGVPLFVEELTRSVLEMRGASGSDAEIPQTLEASLLSRFDRLGEAKEIAQAAAAIGREFEAGLLATVAEVEEERLAELMEGCVASGLMRRRGTKHKTSYAFKHALVQAVAYKTLLRGRRRELHVRIAGALKADYPGVAMSQPEILAHHLTEGELFVEAIHFWRTAGDLATQRSAAVEAASHYGQALELIRKVEPTRELRQKELETLLRYASALRTTKGHGNVLTGDTCSRALDLARELGERQRLLPALNGLYSFHLVRGEHAAAAVAARELLQVARAQSDDAYEMIGSRAVGVVLLHVGRLQEAAVQLEHALARYDESRHRLLAFVYGSDHATTCSCFLALAKWILGDAEGALDQIQWGVRYAEGLAHAFSLAQALGYLAIVHVLAREYESARAVARRMLALAERHSFSRMVSQSSFLLAVTRTGRGNAKRAARDMFVAAEAYNEGAGNYRPLALTLCAQAHTHTGTPRVGLDLIAAAEKATAASGERWAEAELFRVKGELLAQAGNLDDAETALDAAIATARAQHAKSFELRAAVSRARLLLGQGRGDALGALRAVRESYGGGLTSSDLAAADALLAD